MLRARGLLSALLVGVLVALAAPALAQAAELPLTEKLVASNCKVSTCGQEEKEPGFFEPKPKITEGEAISEGFTQAGGRVPFGVTDFKVFTNPEPETGVKPEYKTGTVEPTFLVTHIRTDVAPGLATNPFAVERCTLAEFGEETIPTSGLFTAPGGKCVEIGQQFATVFGGLPKKGGIGDLPLSGKVYDVVPGEGEKMANGAKLASLYGVALALPVPLTGAKLKAGFEQAEKEGKAVPPPPVQKILEEKEWFAHSLIKGNVEWGKETIGKNQGDFHDYFEIDTSPELPLVRSRLVFFGTVGDGAFITNATSCPGHVTTTLKLTGSEGGEAPPKEFSTPIGLSGCPLLFEPAFGLTSSTSQLDQPNEITAEASLPHNPKAPDESQVKSASFTLPEGMTLNPSAAHGLEACTPKQAHQEGTVFGPQFGVECPAGSKIGTVTLNVPTLPPGTLTGNVYLAGPESGPITGPPYNMYVVANTEQYGVSVRLLGETVPNETTGQVTTFFRNPPEQPFTNIAIHFERGVLAPIANPLICGTAGGSASFEPTANPGVATPVAFGVPITGCAGPTPAFQPTQATANQSSAPGAHTSFTFALERTDGQQYFSGISTTLPEGLVGLIPSTTQCSESAANSESEECPSTSRLGTAVVNAGAGPTPFQFTGPVYLTGPYKGAPFGLSIKVAAVSGPFNLGIVVARAKIDVDPYTARVTTSDAEIPRIRRGIPTRLKKIVVNIEKQGFLINPTSCAPLSTESTATGFITPGSNEGSTFKLAPSPFQLTGCKSQGFKPAFKAATGAKTSRANGASLETTIDMPAGQSNIKSVLVQLPPELPSRLTTLNKACPEATFAANPYNCGGSIGGARANTPTLPGKLTGPAYFVSHGGQAFPDLDLVMNANGVRVILVGNTKITKGITTTHFAAPPDVPVSSITVNLPTGPKSALAAFGNFCKKTLKMPTTIEAQNGKVFKQTTTIKVNGCGVQIVGQKVIGHTGYLTIKTFNAGRISASGNGVQTVVKHLGGAVNATSLKFHVSSGNRKVRVGFFPKNPKVGTSVAYTTLHVH
jgi:hypothetical protein